MINKHYQDSVLATDFVGPFDGCLLELIFFLYFAEKKRPYML